MANHISEVQIVPIKPVNGHVGFASLVFDNCFYLGSIGIFTRPEGGYRLTYPNKLGKQGRLNIYHPINHDIADEVETEIISKFEEVINK